MANKQYFASFKGKVVTVYDFSGGIFRRFQMKDNVVNVIIDNPSFTIAITTSKGTTFLYKLDGFLLRQYNG
jgi:hypothetical protein